MDAEAYHGSISLGSVVPALGYGRVVSSSSPKLKVGAMVQGMLGAQTMACVPASQCFPLTTLPGVPETDCLGALSLTTGLTAWVGMRAVLGPPRKGEIVVVSAAAGAVGSIAAQLAKHAGARVLGVAGGEPKCAFLTETLGLDGAIDYKHPTASIAEQLDRLAPDGVDFFMDNAGGEVLDAVLARIRKRGRVVICGAASQYSTPWPVSGGHSCCSLTLTSSYLKLFRGL